MAVRLAILVARFCFVPTSLGSLGIRRTTGFGRVSWHARHVNWPVPRTRGERPCPNWRLLVTHLCVPKIAVRFVGCVRRQHLRRRRSGRRSRKLVRFVVGRLSHPRSDSAFLLCAPPPHCPADEFSFGDCTLRCSCVGAGGVDWAPSLGGRLPRWTRHSLARSFAL